jgi:predicted acyl esterase
VKLQSTCFSCAAGQALRVSISAASFPAYTVNPGKAIAHADSRLIDAQIITLSVNCSHPQSYLLLPSG